jgi:hypothetical protein
MMIKRCVVVVLSVAFLFSACGGSGSDVAAFCTQVRAFRAKYGSDFNPADKKKVAQAKIDLRTMANDAPKSIRADASSVSDAFDFFADGKSPPAYRNQEIQTASENLTKYGEDHCGIKPTPTTTG